MKNRIQVVTILVVVISFFSVHPMVPNGHILELDELKYVNPLLHMNRLTVWPLTDGHNIPDDDQFFSQDGLKFKLATIKFLEESDKTKKKDTLEAIYNAVCEGKPITSKHIIGPNASKIAIFIVPSQNSIPIFMLIEN